MFHSRTTACRFTTIVASTLIALTALVGYSAGQSSADALCDQMRQQHGPNGPCISVPTYTPPPTIDPPPTAPDATTTPQNEGPVIGGDPGPGPGHGDGTPIVGVDPTDPSPATTQRSPAPTTTDTATQASPQRAPTQLQLPDVGRHNAGCNSHDQGDCSSAYNFDSYKLCEAQGGYMAGSRPIAKFVSNIYMTCDDWRHIIAQGRFQDTITDADRLDYTTCVSKALSQGEEWDRAKPPNQGYKYMNPQTGVWVYVSVRPVRPGETIHTIATAFTSGDGKDWGGCAA